MNESDTALRYTAFPETAFVLASRPDRHYALRYWSPSDEVPFCGHATVATATALAERDGVGTMVFETQAGEVAIAATADDSGAITVAFTSVEPYVRDLDADLLDRLLELLGLFREDLDPKFPVKEAFAGNLHPVLTLKDVEIFHQFRFAPKPLSDLMRQQGWKGTVVVLHEAGPGEFLARNLFPTGRFTEDPATGSGAAAVGAYLRSIGQAAPGTTIRIHQGAHVGRPSLLTVTIPAQGGITVSGTAARIHPEE